MTAVKVKICGLTRARDVVGAIACGADALGFVFANSKRRISIGQAQRLVAEAKGDVLRVGLFMDQSADLVKQVLAAVSLDLLQFHGNEDNDYCTRFGMPFIKAVSMHGNGLSGFGARFPDASGVLLDSHAPGRPGGSGKTFDWGKVVDPGLPLWLAGGLTPANVAEAVERCAPYAVDVSSGVEDAPGVKNERLLRDFVRYAKAGKS